MPASPRSASPWRSVARWIRAVTIVVVVAVAALPAGAAAAADPAAAADSDDPAVRGHSPRIVRLALTGAPDPEALAASLAFDAELQRSGRLGALRVTPVEGAAQARADAVLARLLAALPRRPVLAWRVRVLATEPARDNAFVAGGPVLYVYDGLMSQADGDDELAFVFGHEMAHTMLKHDRRQAADRRLRRVEDAATDASPPERLGQALRAAYARADEQEADALGAWLAHRAGYDPALAVSWFERQLSRAGSAAGPAAASPAIAAPPQGVPARPGRGTGDTPRQRWATLIAQADRTHPDDARRWAALLAVDDYLDGRRTVPTPADIGQGARVLQALADLARPAGTADARRRPGPVP